MTQGRLERNQLLALLQRFEWRDFEAKEARKGMPKGIYETVSAFANTEAGHIVFGVSSKGGAYEIVGVLEVDKVQNEFLSGLRSHDTISFAVDVQKQAQQEADRTILAFYIPEAPRHAKPVHLGRDISKSFVRRGGCDQRCTPVELGRFLRNASTERFDGRPVARPLDRSLDPNSVRWYRTRYREKVPESPLHDLDDAGFLEHWGLVIDREGERRPTVAAILLLGSGAALRSVRPDPTVDCLWYGYAHGDPLPEVRWQDRLVLEENLVQSWRRLLEWYLRRREAPFQLDPATLRREDRPEDYVSFREAALNLLTHQDYEEGGRKASIGFYTDRVVFSNPGTAFEPTSTLLQPGDRQVRNPLIVEAFRRIGVGERAGTGLLAIFRDWHRLGRVPPVIESDPDRYEFRLTLLREELLSERQLHFQASLGVRLGDDQAAALAMLVRSESVSLAEVATSLARPQKETEADLQYLVSQILAAPHSPGRYQLAPHLRKRFPLKGGETYLPDDASDQSAPVTDQATSRPPPSLVTRAANLPELDERQRRLLLACDTPQTIHDLMGLAGLRHRTYFRRRCLAPLLAAHLVQYQYPERPTHPDQRIALTEAGLRLVTKLLEKERHEP